MNRREWALVAGLAALTSAVGGAVGNHLPWPSTLDDHPLWVTAAFFGLAAVLGVTTTALALADNSEPTVPASSPPLSTTALGGVAAGDMTAAAGAAAIAAGAGSIAVGAGGSLTLAAPQPQPVAPLPIPAAEFCVGRDAEIDDGVEALAGGRTLVVLGPPGIGKSTVLTQILADPRLAAHSGPGRLFLVPCDGADSQQSVIDKMALHLGVPLGDHLLNRVLQFLAEDPCVLALDNFETVVDEDPKGAGDLVARLRSRALPTVLLALGHRGASVPLGLTGVAPLPLGPLSGSRAVEVFLEHAGERHRDEPDLLSSLVEALDGVPLAIVLLGALAATEPSLSDLWTAWQSQRSDLLRRGAGADRTSSMQVSVELSWARLSPEGQGALSIAAALPNGWPAENHSLYMPGHVEKGLMELRQRALLQLHDSRERCLAPIRDHVLRHHPPAEELAEKFVSLLSMLAESSGQVGRDGSGSTIAELSGEFANLVEALRWALAQHPQAAAAVPGVVGFQRFTGLGDDQLGLEALEATRNDELRSAELNLSLGMLAFSRGANDRARGLINQALPLYQRVGAVLGEANCLSNLGEVEFSESNNDRARELINQALPLYQRVGDLLGRANCLSNLGEVEFSESNSDRARELLNQALPLYQRIRDPYSQAITHAWLARVSDEAERAEHCAQLDALAQKVKRPGFREQLGQLAGY